MVGHLEVMESAIAFPKDSFISALRKWVNEYEADPFQGELPPPLPTEALLDRYYSHTSKCTSCRGALVNIKRLRLGIAIVGALIWATLPLLIFILDERSMLLAILCAVIPLTAGATWLWLGKLERQLSKGREVPLRNLPERKNRN